MDLFGMRNILSMIEQRKMERFPGQYDASLFVTDGTPDLAGHQLQTENICAGGAYLKSGKPLPIGTDVNIELLMPLGELMNMPGKEARVKAAGTIVRSSEDGMAIVFEEGFQIFSA